MSESRGGLLSSLFFLKNQPQCLKKTANSFNFVLLFWKWVQESTFQSVDSRCLIWDAILWNKWNFLLATLALQVLSWIVLHTVTEYTAISHDHILLEAWVTHDGKNGFTYPLFCKYIINIDILQVSKGRVQKKKWYLSLWVLPPPS